MGVLADGAAGTRLSVHASLARLGGRCVSCLLRLLGLLLRLRFGVLLAWMRVGAFRAFATFFHDVVVGLAHADA